MRRLIIRPGAIGDCILALPAMEHLIADYTEVWISTPLTPLISFADRVRPISCTGLELAGLADVEFPAGLRERLAGFDSIVSWYGTNRPEFREALTSWGIPCEFLTALPPESFEGHAGDFFARQVGADQSLLPRVRVENFERRRSVTIQPFSGSPRKNWPLASFQELAMRLRPIGVEWTVGPEEELAGATRFANLADLASWIAASTLYIGNDSGITHLAAATGVPTLALFGVTDPQKWAPRGSNVTVLQAATVTDLAVSTVGEAVSRLLDSPMISASI